MVFFKGEQTSSQGWRILSEECQLQWGWGGGLETPFGNGMDSRAAPLDRKERNHLEDGRLQVIQIRGYRLQRSADAERAWLRAAAGEGRRAEHIPMVAEKMTIPSTFMPSMVSGSDL